MTTLILQFFYEDKKLTPSKKELYFKCMKTVKRYAKNVGYEYILEKKHFLPDWDPHWQIFKVFETKEYDQYDKIICLDADVFIENTRDLVFDKYNEFSACLEVDNDRIHRRPEYKKWGKNYFNSGILVFTKESIEAIRNNSPEKYRKKYKNTIPGRDQMALNAISDEVLGGYRRIDRSDACFLRDFSENNAPVVHLAGRCRQKYFKDPEHWDAHFEVDKC